MNDFNDFVEPNPPVEFLFSVNDLPYRVFPRALSGRKYWYMSNGFSVAYVAPVSKLTTELMENCAKYMEWEEEE